MSRTGFGAILGLGLLASVNASALPANETDLPNGVGQTTSLTVAYGTSSWVVTFNPNATLNSCAVDSQGNNCSGILATGTVDTHGNLSVVFTESGGILSSASVTADDLSVFETVQAPTGDKILSASLTVTGTATGTGVDSGSEYVAVNGGGLPGAVLGTASVSLVSPKTSVTSLTGVSTTPNSIFVTKDIGAAGGTSGTASVTTVTQVFNVPEPASMSVLGMGIIGIAGLRRRRARG